MASNDRFLIGRQPILNNNKGLIGYELLFRSAESLEVARLKDPSHATASVIVSTLSGIGITELLGGQRGFINIDTDMLMSDSIEILPKELIGFELQDSIWPSAQVVERCRELKEAGFILTLDGHKYLPEHEPLYQLADIVKIDLLQDPEEKLKKKIAIFKSYGLKLLAEKIDSTDAFDMSKQFGFELFQGYFFARPTLVEKMKPSGSKPLLLKLLKLLLADALTAEIIDVFKSSPTLTYKLLILVNSVSFGLREKIRDVRHAITLLGRQQLKRWIQLSLFSADDSSTENSPLLDMAVARAVFMEELAVRHPQLKKRFGASDQAFMVGILSLLGEIYNISIEHLVTELNLSDDVYDALLNHGGIYGQMLEMTLCIERFDLGAAAIGLQNLGIPMDEVIDSHHKALTQNKEM